MDPRPPEPRRPRPSARRLAAPSRRFRDKFARELVALLLSEAAGPRDPVTEDHLAALPEPASRMMRFAGVVGRPRDWSFCAHWHTRFRLGPDKPWLASEVWQYDSSIDVARVFHMRLRVGRVVPTYVRDLYVRGTGRMVGRLLDAVPLVDDASEAIAVGELVTYLNDAVLFAPSMLLGPATRWRSVDDRSFDVALTDRGRTVEARVFVAPDGAVTAFSTTDRFGQDPDAPHAGLVRARWTTPVDGWTGGDRPRPTAMRAVWHFPSGEFCYAEASTADMSIAFNVSPRRLDAAA